MLGIIIDAIAVLFVIIFSIALGLGISQPFQGALIRLRANYLPKAVSLDNVLEDGAASSRHAFAEFIQSSEAKSAAKIGPVVPGIFAMMRRTKRLEGWAGLYKGSVPTVIQLVWLWIITWVVFDSTSSGFGGSYRAAPAGPGNFAFWGNLVFMLLLSFAALPLNVISFRVIVHPRILPLNKPMANLQEILSYSELRNPLKLYTIPGLATATVLHIGWIGIATRIMRHLLVPMLGGLDVPEPIKPGETTFSGPTSDTKKYSTIGLVMFFLWNLASLPVLAPIECAMVRLSTQRPEKQNPLHLAYAKPASTLNSYSHQASVPAQTSPQATAAETDMPSRTSFAIEDQEEAEEAAGNAFASEPLNPQSASANANATPAPVSAPTPAPPRYLPTISREPAEPVIALRPCDEADSAEEAARLEREGGFGAPVVSRYTGLVDCLRKMRDEEGIESLGRGWWVTLNGLLIASFS
ncbi:hypothetical protein K437DRAFT_250029 [Tilletiaria anomala UBC 951]|uniref:Mitochondrial carrier n=1 Tax=Tilletiaria anomala (strain ATCC 24038 / CBS 436.72 / UBC 951) TaxID=1037660 RepID=A0A066VGI7_TILAU|nr:uncharacterized protein K437DRAFT_250029 [Tilletiaria anomala UBC 951]KDN40616.1 hypothetical protein K437DRAFT_250029 [Tilletiaria anomala UBC 951]